MDQTARRGDEQQHDECGTHHLGRGEQRLPRHRGGEAGLVEHALVAPREVGRQTTPEPDSNRKGAILPAPALAQQFSECVAGVGCRLGRRAVADAPGLVAREHDLIAENAVLGKKHDPLERSDRVETAQIGVKRPLAAGFGRRRAHRAPAKDAELARDDAQVARGDLGRPSDGLLHHEVHVLPDGKRAGAAAGRRRQDAAGGGGDVRLVRHIGDQFRDCARPDDRPGIELIDQVGDEGGADPLEKEGMRMELAAILILDADGKTDFAREPAIDPKARHDIVDALP